MLKKFVIIFAVFTVLLSLLQGCSGGGQNNTPPDGGNGGDSNSGEYKAGTTNPNLSLILYSTTAHMI